MNQKPVLKDRRSGRKKLALNRETLRELTARELNRLVGGVAEDSELGTHTRLCLEEIPVRAPDSVPCR